MKIPSFDTIAQASFAVGALLIIAFYIAFMIEVQSMLAPSDSPRSSATSAPLR